MHQEKLKEELENFVLCPAEMKNIQKYRPDLKKGRVILLPSNEHIQHLKKNMLKRDLFCSSTGTSSCATKLSAMQTQLEQYIPHSKDKQKKHPDGPRICSVLP